MVTLSAGRDEMSRGTRARAQMNAGVLTAFLGEVDTIARTNGFNGDTLYVRTG